LSDDRLRTEIWVMAHIRRCSGDGIPATVVRRGDANGGTVVVKLNQLDQGCRVLSQSRDIDGTMGWLGAFDGALVSEAEADAYIGRAVMRDPDIWVVEIEDRNGRHPFEGRIF
jgi:hypothetical protein